MIYKNNNLGQGAWGIAGPPPFDIGRDATECPKEKSLGIADLVSLVQDDAPPMSIKCRRKLKLIVLLALLLCIFPLFFF